MLNVIVALSRRVFLRILSFGGVALVSRNGVVTGGEVVRNSEGHESSKIELEKRELVLAQIYVAFGQGTGEIRVGREACLALRTQALPQLETMLAHWDTEAVQILERVRAIGRAARQRAVSRFDTVVQAQDVEFVAPQVKAVSGTPLCAPDSHR